MAAPEWECIYDFTVGCLAQLPLQGPRVQGNIGRNSGSPDIEYLIARCKKTYFFPHFFPETHPLTMGIRYYLGIDMGF